MFLGFLSMTETPNSSSQATPSLCSFPVSSSCYLSVLQGGCPFLCSGSSLMMHCSCLLPVQDGAVGLGCFFFSSSSSVLGRHCEPGAGILVGWEDPLGEGMATHSSILAWRIPMERGSWRAIVHGVSKSWTRLSN